MQSTTQKRPNYFSHEAANRRRLIDALMFLFGDFSVHSNMIIQLALIATANFETFVRLAQWIVEFSDVIVGFCQTVNRTAEAIDSALDWCGAVYLGTCRAVDFILTGRIVSGVTL